ncbi:MAG: radical SAM protein [Pseudonocardiales bacterium]
MPPFTTYVVKIYEFCNLNCTYCYMYNLADQSYLSKPVRMSERTRDAFFSRLVEHARDHKINPVTIVLHGGEPLLTGKDYLDRWITNLREALGSTRSLVRLQTNGILLDDEWVDLLCRHDVRVGISLDGPAEYNDRFRVDLRGRGSYDRVLTGLRRLMDHPRGADVFGAILSVANPRIPATEMWDFWRGLGVTRYDFNLPHCTHDQPPWFTQDDLTTWMIELFDLWWAADDPQYEIRFFKNIVDLVLGAPFSTDYIGGKAGGIAVVETDGSIQGADALRACEDGLVELGLSVHHHAFDDALRNPLVQLANHSSAQLCETCQACRVREVCGGGYLPHRYSRARRFDNPSVYCDSLYAIISHIRERVVDSLGSLAKETHVAGV